MPNRIFSTRNVSNKRILIIGDVMLDHYVHGTCGRISPEAPVPVVRVVDERFVLGGAANVAANVRATGAHTTCIGIVGKDSDRIMLEGLLGEIGVESLLRVCKGFRTIRKTRVVAHGQQIVRCDYETHDRAKTTLVEKAISKNIMELAPKYDAIIISDYDKGVCTNGIIRKVASNKLVPWIVDPKKPWSSKYPGASLITPNAKEASHGSNAVANPTQAGKAAYMLLKRTRANGVAITIGGHGACLAAHAAKETSVMHFPVAPVEVFDPTGAGDVFVAFAALAFAIGASTHDAVRLANAAAAVSVGRHGATVVTWDEAVESLSAQPASVLLSRHG